MIPAYTDQVHLLVNLLPIVEKQDCFALKGGTAINLFFRDMPRLSVYIDLAYLPVEDRETSLSNINRALENIKEDITKRIPLPPDDYRAIRRAILDIDSFEADVANKIPEFRGHPI